MFSSSLEMKLIESLLTGNFKGIEIERLKLKRLWSTTPGVEYLLDPFLHWKTIDISSYSELEQIENSHVEVALLSLYLNNEHFELRQKLITKSKNHLFWNRVFENRNLRLKPTIDSNQYLELIRIVLDVQVLVEKVRLDHLRRSGFFPQPIDTKDPKATQLSSLLSTSYYTVLEFHSIQSDIVNANFDFLCVYAESLPLSWFTFDLLETMRSMLQELLDKDGDATSVLRLVAAHAQLPGSQELDGTSELLYEYAIRYQNQYALFAIIGYLTNDISSEKLQNQLLTLLDQEVVLDAAFARLFARLLAIAPPKQFTLISKEFLTARVKVKEENDILKITQMYYFVGDVKSQDYDSGGVMWNPIRLIKEGPIPELFRVLQEGCAVDGIYSHFAMLGIMYS
jgi:hypothetical protein